SNPARTSPTAQRRCSRWPSAWRSPEATNDRDRNPYRLSFGQPPSPGDPRASEDAAHDDDRRGCRRGGDRNPRAPVRDGVLARIEPPRADCDAGLAERGAASGGDEASALRDDAAVGADPPAARRLGAGRRRRLVERPARALRGHAV